MAQVVTLILMLVVVIIAKLLQRAEIWIRENEGRPTADQVVEHNQEKAKWLQQVLDERLEMELEQKIWKKDPEARKEISDAYHDMGYHSTGEYYEIPDSKAGRDDALRILMAWHGKLRRVDAYSWIENYVDPNIPTRIEGRKNYESQLRYALWIDKQLRKHGIRQELLFVDESGNVLKISESRYRRGRYRWKPTILIAKRW